jgi:Peptidase family M13
MPRAKSALNLTTVSIVSICFVALAFSQDDRDRYGAGPCASFYDDSCRMDYGGDDGGGSGSKTSSTTSHFSSLRNQHKRTKRIVVSKYAAFDKCAKSLSDGSASSVLSLFSRGGNFRARVPKASSTQAAPTPGTSFYPVHVTSRAISRGSIGCLHPVKADVSKKLDGEERCLELSPNAKWLNSVSEFLESPLFRELSSLDSDKARVLKGFSDKMNRAFDRSVERSLREGDDGDGNPRTHVQRYSTLSAYVRKSSKTGATGENQTTSATETTRSGYTGRSGGDFWRDVLSNAYDIDDPNYCVNGNGYEEYYSEYENQVTSLTMGTEILEMLDALGKDLYFDRIDVDASNSSSMSSRGKVKRHKNWALDKCEKTLIKIARETFNEDFLIESGSVAAFGNAPVVERMIDELSVAISATLKRKSETEGTDAEFWDFAQKKLSTMTSYVLNKNLPGGASKSSLSIRACLMDEVSTWDETVSCLSDVRRSRSSELANEPLSGESEDRRYAQLYGTVDVSIVNAWYDPTRNEITVPAGILFPPVYSGNSFYGHDPYDQAKLGMILGHEIGHAVDSNGLCWNEVGRYDFSRRFCDSQVEGTLVPPGIASSMECLSAEYGHPCGPDDEYGERTLGEDMADQVGLFAAWNAFETELDSMSYVPRAEGKKEFFRRYAALWCDGNHPSSGNQPHSAKYEAGANNGKEKCRTEGDCDEERAIERRRKKVKFESGTSRTPKFDSRSDYDKGKGAKKASEYDLATCERLAKDPHALPKHRVDTTLKQFRPFSDLFECPPDSKMYKADPCVVY